MAVNHYFKVFSNDGSTTLFTTANTVNNSTIITVTETGLTIGTETYTYSGEKKFIGVSTSASTTSPDHAIGESFDGNAAYAYIVEAEPTTSGVTVEYNSAVVATIPSGNKATIPVADKKMKTDIVITVPEAEVLPEFTEVEDFSVLANGADEGSLELAYSVSQDVKLSAASPAPLVSIDDANFIANNIKKDVSIFGLVGAYEGEDKATPIEVSTEAEMTALLTSGEVGGVYKYTGTTGTYENGALYVLEADASVDVTVSITNTSTRYTANVITQDAEGKNTTIGNVGINSTSEFIVPNGTKLALFAKDAVMPSWSHTSLTGDIVIDGAYYFINGDGTIVGYAYDSD